MDAGDLALNNLQWLICHKIQPNQSVIAELGVLKRVNFMLLNSLCQQYIF